MSKRLDKMEKVTDWYWALDDAFDDMAAVIRAGVDDSPMTPFEGTLSDEQINAVATYVVHALVSQTGR